METERKKVLFLCTANTCRSQLAEAIVNSRMGKKWQAYSAGVRPGERLHPLAGKALAEIGIQHNGYPKSPDVFRDTEFDLVVTVCDPAAESCPVWLKDGKVVHFPLEDPAAVSGSAEEQMQVFRKVRDKIVREIGAVLAGVSTGV